MMMIVISFMLSLDALLLGFTFGINNIRLLKKSFVCLNAAALAVNAATYTLGSLLNVFCDEVWSRTIGSLLIIGMGFFILAESFEETEKSEKNIKSLNMLESAAAGAALSADAAVICTGLAAGGRAGAALPVVLCIVQAALLYIGTELGKKTGKVPRANKLVYVLGFAAVMYGLYELTPIFCV